MTTKIWWDDDEGGNINYRRLSSVIYFRSNQTNTNKYENTPNTIQLKRNANTSYIPHSIVINKYCDENIVGQRAHAVHLFRVLNAINYPDWVVFTLHIH